MGLKCSFTQDHYHWIMNVRRRNVAVRINFFQSVDQVLLLASIHFGLLLAPIELSSKTRGLPIFPLGQIATCTSDQAASTPRRGSNFRPASRPAW